MKILFILLLQVVCATFVTPTFDLRPKPRKDLSIGTNGRKIIKIELQIIPTAALAIISVGDPPEEVRLHLNMGVELTWVLPKPNTLYSSSKSSSFSHVSCEGLRAEFLFPKDSRNSPCRYKIELGDGALYEGSIGRETFTYRTGYRGFSTIQDVYFGVGEETKKGVQVGKGSLGLGLGEMSIIHHFGEKFSICIGNFNEMEKGRHFLSLGEGAFLTGKQIPLHTIDKYYIIFMTSITINGDDIGLQNVLGESPTIVDAGASDFGLVSTAFDVVLREINKKLNVTGVPPLFLFSQLYCQIGTIPKHLDIELGLEFGDLTINFPTEKLFLQVHPHVFCLHVRKTTARGENILGIAAFQGHNIGIDIPKQKMYVKPIDCDVLFDGYKDELSHPDP